MWDDLHATTVLSQWALRLVRSRVQAEGFTLHTRPLGEEAEAIVRCPSFKARRWVVDRTQNRFRRRPVRWEKRDDTYLAMVHLAFDIITQRTTGLLGRALTAPWSPA